MKRSPINPISDKRRKENRERRKNLHAAYGESPACAVRWDAGCRGWADDAHEPVRRSHGTDITDPDQSTPCCRHCHTALHHDVAEAQRRGWLVPSWEA